MKMPGALKARCSGTINGPSAWEVEAGGSGVQSQPQPHMEFKASPGYVRLCLTKRGGDWETGQLVKRLLFKYEDLSFNLQNSRYENTNKQTYV